MMTRRLIIAVVLCGITLAATAKEPETMDQLKARAEAADKGKQPDLFSKLAAMQAEAANDAYNTNVDQAKKLIEEAAESAKRASAASLESGKRQKKTEIDLRQLAKRMDDIGKSWAFDDRVPVKTAIQQVEAARSKLLDRMFEK